MFLESNREPASKRRFPRVFMNVLSDFSNAEAAPALLSGALLALPQRTHVPVIDISVSGVVIYPQGILSQLRLGNIIDCKLKLAGLADPVPLRLRVLRMNAQNVCLMMESISSEFRLKLPQNSKDQLIFQNLRPRSTRELHPTWQNSQWLHGALDTNFIVSRDEGKNLRQVLIEYDGILVKYEPSLDEKSEFILQKSLPSTDEARGYSGLWMDAPEHKISLGRDWKERLIHRLQTVLNSKPEHFEVLSTILNVAERL